jgi:hypothetical protein
MAVNNQHKDIKEFGNLRKQLAPLLPPEKSQLLQRIEAMLGAGPLPVPQRRPIKRESHASRVKRYLVPR